MDSMHFFQYMSKFYLPTYVRVLFLLYIIRSEIYFLKFTVYLLRFRVTIPGIYKLRPPNDSERHTMGTATGTETFVGQCPTKEVYEAVYSKYPGLLTPVFYGGLYYLGLYYF